RCTLFPYTTLFRSVGAVRGRVGELDAGGVGAVLELHAPGEHFRVGGGGAGAGGGALQVHQRVAARGTEGDLGRVPGGAGHARAAGVAAHAPAVRGERGVGVRGVVEVVEQGLAALAGRVGRIRGVGRVVALGGGA